jgi:hypothetical protein
MKPTSARWGLADYVGGSGFRSRAMRASTALALLCLAACTPPRAAVRPTTPAPVTAPAPVCKPCEELKPPRPPQSLLLNHVPATATFALVIRRHALSWIEDALTTDAVLREELRAHFMSELGVDFTGAQGLVVVGFAEGERLDLALFVHVPSLTQLKGTVRGLHREIPLVSSDASSPWLGASLSEGVWMGHQRAVERVLDHELDHGTSLFLDVDGSDVDVLGFLRFQEFQQTTVAALAKTFGIDHAVLKLDDARKLTLILKGHDARIDQAKTAFEAGLKIAVDQLAQMAHSGDTRDPWSKAFSLFIYHEVRRFAEAATPRVVGTSLVSEYALGPWLDSAPVGMAAAALTVPTVLAHVTRGKTSQVYTELARVASALSFYHDNTKPKPGAAKKIKIPPISHLRIGRTPRVVPCGTEARWDEDEVAAWQELGYAPTAPMRYTLEVGSPTSLGRKGVDAALIVRAEGDLDCDGIKSRFDLLMRIDEQGNLVRVGEIETQDAGE